VNQETSSPQTPEDRIKKQTKALMAKLVRLKKQYRAMKEKYPDLYIEILEGHSTPSDTPEPKP
jgi:hypothetical protein